MTQQPGRPDEIKAQGDKVANRATKTGVVVLIVAAFVALLGIFLAVGMS